MHCNRQFPLCLRRLRRRVTSQWSDDATLLRDNDADGVTAPLTGRRCGLQRCGHDRGIHVCVCKCTVNYYRQIYLKFPRYWNTLLKFTSSRYKQAQISIVITSESWCSNNRYLEWIFITSDKLEQIQYEQLYSQNWIEISFLDDGYCRLLKFV